MENLPTSCQFCDHCTVKEIDLFGTLSQTPTCDLTEQSRGGQVCPHEFSGTAGLTWKSYRPDWCPLESQ